MRSDLNEFVTKYLTLVGATMMLVGFVAFVTTANDVSRIDNQTSALQVTPTSASTTGS